MLTEKALFPLQRGSSASRSGDLAHQSQWGFLCIQQEGCRQLPMKKMNYEKEEGLK
jgi:hypothetical protein